MYKIISCLVFALMINSSLLAQVNKQGHKKKWVTVSGKVSFLNTPDWLTRPGYHNKVIAGKGVGRKFVPVDSVAVQPDGSYKIRLDATIPSFYQINFVNWDNIEVFSDDNMVINVRGFDTGKYKYKTLRYVHIGSNSINNKILNIINNHNYWAYYQSLQDIQEQNSAEQYKSKDSTWLSYVKKEKQEGLIAKTTTDKMIHILLRDFPDMPVTVKLVEKMNWRKDTTTAMAILDGLVKKYPWLAEAKKLKNDMRDYMVRIGMLANGKPAPAFTYQDTEGKLVDFASYRGKYVLIDFWASWCGPCRKAMPKVKEQLALYKDKGLEVLGVSIDENKAAWLKAVEEENAPWVQLLSPDMDQTMKDYMFTGIPTLYLVDPYGNIVDKFTGYSSELEERLQQVFVNKKSL